MYNYTTGKFVNMVHMRATSRYPISKFGDMVPQTCLVIVVAGVQVVSSEMSCLTHALVDSLYSIVRVTGMVQNSKCTFVKLR